MAKAEFDDLAETYYEEHKKNIEITGESPEYFAEYKVADLARYISAAQGGFARIADFGSGIGNSIAPFRKYFPGAALSCLDVSEQSIARAQDRFPGKETHLLIEADRIPLEDASQDIVFSACVFHHISASEHRHWMSELLRIARPGGVLAIYEHNPFNPLTVRAFNTCALDENAEMIWPWALRRCCQEAGWRKVSIGYRLFFPRALAYLRPLERGLGWLCLGAQYRLLALR